MVKQSLSGICFLLFSTFALSSETVKAPRGWNEQYVGPVREVSNGNATVRIMPWQSLAGLSIEQWLDGLQHDDPQGGALLSTEGIKRSKVSGFKSGDRITLAFGRIGGFGIDGLESSTSVLRGGDVVMSKDGMIAIGSWNASRMSANAASARAFSARKGGMIGRYYLDGHTISIATNDGEIVHGLIGVSNRNSEYKITALFLNGKHYWDRNK